MSDHQQPSRALPAHPSEERLRKLAKRLAASDRLKLAGAQARLAREHGFRNWAELIRAVRNRAGTAGRSPLSEAAARADLKTVEALLAAGAAVDGEPHEADTPLFLACGSSAPAGDRLATVERLLDAGAFVRAFCTGGSTPLHAAARAGPAALVELLLKRGALAWQTDGRDRRPEEEAKAGTPLDRERILFLCSDGPKLSDPIFQAAVVAIQSGDEAELVELLDRDPDLLRRRAMEPPELPRGYFSDPKLFWFIANNPTLQPASPPNIAAVTRLMLARGVEPADVDYALELVMTNGQMTRPMQIEMAATLVEAGARISRQAMLMTLGHCQTEVVAWLVDQGRPLDAPTAAGLGRIDVLAGLLATASEQTLNDALSLATINRQPEAVRLTLEAGADPNRFMAIHSHSTPLHQAALNDDVATMRLLIDAGARLDVQDTLWRGTPMGWAMHGNSEAAQALLKERSA